MDDSGRPAVTQGASTPTNTPTSSFSVAHSPLFKSPRELRDYIYEYSFYSLYTPNGSGEYDIKVTKDEGLPEPALLLTCKTIREEAIMLLYGQDRLNLVIHSYDPAVMLLMNAERVYLKRDYNLTAAVQHASRAGPISWDNLKRTPQLVHSGHQLFVLIGARGVPNYSEEEEYLQGLTNVVRSMYYQKWDFVEDTLQMLRQGLVALNPNWAN
ncbi:hypothetical protein MBLNU13_g06898t1 [Cladosporium sp. NU13]